MRKRNEDGALSAENRRKVTFTYMLDSRYRGDDGETSNLLIRRVLMDYDIF